LTITFESDIDIIIYALEEIIAYARRSQQIFVAQCVWWIASVIGLKVGLITYIDYLRSEGVQTTPKASVPTQGPQEKQDLERTEKVHKEGEKFLQDSRRL
jgi:hypothetical protein